MTFNKSPKIQPLLDDERKEPNMGIIKMPSLSLLDYIFPDDDWQRVSRISEIMVREQTKEHNQECLFKLVIKDNLDGLKREIKEIAKNALPKSDSINRSSSRPFAFDGTENQYLLDNPDIAAVVKTDAVGSSIIHVAYLLKRYRIGRWLVENYPIASLLPYSSDLNQKVIAELEDEGYDVTPDDMPYTGSNILHMTIIQKNHTETRWLLDFYRDHKHSVQLGLETLLLEDTTGKFFSDRNGPFYFGCFPLHFAVCSNDTDMFDLILSYTSSLDGNALNNHKKAYSALRNQDGNKPESLHQKSMQEMSYLHEKGIADNSHHKSSSKKIDVGEIPYGTPKLSPKKLHPQGSTNPLQDESRLNNNNTTTNKDNNIDSHEEKSFGSPLSLSIQFGIEEQDANLLPLDATPDPSPSKSNMTQRKNKKNKKPKKIVEHNKVAAAPDIKNKINNNGDSVEMALSPASNNININTHTTGTNKGTSNIMYRRKNPTQLQQQHQQQLEASLRSSASAPAATSGSIRGHLGSAVIFMRDRDGNNCLHLAVIHHLHDMYKHVKKTAEAMIKKEIILGFTDMLIAKGEKLKGVSFNLKPLPLWKSPSQIANNNSKSRNSNNNNNNNKSTQLQVTQVEWNNGFRYGYSPVETPIVIPFNGDINKKDTLFSSWLQEQTEKILQARFYYVLNEDLHSPLTLAAAGLKSCRGTAEEQEKVRDTLQFLVSQMKELRWSYGPVRCSLIDLEGLDLPHNVARYKGGNVRPLPPKSHRRMFGAIEWICITSSDQSITIPEIKKLVTEKWERFGKSFFLLRFYIHCVNTFCITLMACLINESPTLYYRTGAELAVTILYPVTALLIIFLVLLELPHLLRHRLNYWGLLSRATVRGAAQFDNIIFTVVSLSYLTLCVSQMVAVQGGYANVYSTAENDNEYAANDNLAIKLSMTVCVITSWMYVYYFLMGLDATGGFVLSIHRIVSKDIPFFMTFYGVIVVAFGLALSLLTNSGGPAASYGIENFLRAVWALFQITIQVGSSDSSVDVTTVSPDLAWIGEIVQAFFYMSVFILMLNLLIAMMTDTYAELQQCSESLLLIEKYNIMNGIIQSLVSFEKQFPFSLINNHFNLVKTADIPKKYGIPIPYADDVEVDVEDLDAAALEEYRANQAQKMTSTSANNPNHILKFAFEIKDAIKDWYESKDVASASDRQKKTVLLIIDPQNDFHEGEGSEDPSYSRDRDPALKLYHAPGSLAVPRANEDSRRIRDMINDHVGCIDEIIVTMDSHFKTHIAHAVCWQCGPRCLKCDPKQTTDRCSPTPFTLISYEDIELGVWAPVDGLQDKEWCLKYTEELERKGNMKLCIWPEHCIIGSYGHAIVPDLNVALQNWAKTRNKAVTYVMKGQNCRTEMYSALKAEVEDPKDPRTALNEELLVKLKIADRVIICGQALSHCVNYTVRDILNYWPSDDLSKLCLIEDGCSPVTTFEKVGEEFIAYIKERGVTVTKADQVFSPSIK